ncbi:MAG: LysR family transcriptional regulator [Rhizobiaceae bacterium]
MDIRQLSYLVALAREKHFTRAADACGVTQPTLSGRIQQLEQELGVPIVIRGNRYIGLTQEGERVLKWAQTILEDVDGLRSDLAHATDAPLGRMIIGAIPSALPTLAPLTNAMRLKFPKLTFTVLSMSSEEIRRSLEDFSIDVGITYLDNEPIDLALSQPLYMERYRLFVRHDHPLAARESVEWAEAARHPVSLLTPNMQNRRIIDSAFREANARVEPELESNSIVNLFTHVQMAGLASVLPEIYIGLMGGSTGIKAIPLVSPVVEHSVGLVAHDRDPLPKVVKAMLDLAVSYHPSKILTARLS